MLWFKMMMALLVTAGVRKPFSAPRAPGQTICKFRQWKANGQFFGHISVPPVGTSQDIAVLPWGYCSPRVGIQQHSRGDTAALAWGYRSTRVGIPQHSRGDTAALRETDVAALYRQTLRRSRDTLFSGKGIGAAPRCVCVRWQCVTSRRAGGRSRRAMPSLQRPVRRNRRPCRLRACRR